VSEFEYGEEYDPLEDAYYADPAGTISAVAAQAAAQEAQRIGQLLAAQQADLATSKNMDVASLEVMRDVESRHPDLDKYRPQLMERMARDPRLMDDLAIDPAGVARRVEDQLRLVKADAQRTTDAQEWRAVQRAALSEPGQYWNERRRLLDVPVSEGGFKE
jgi:hypothetical protein